MYYTNLDNLISIIPRQELINLTNDTTPAQEINQDNINSALAYSDELINSYLRNKYVLPLKYVPALIEQIATDIAAYRLYSRRPRKLPEHITVAYEEAKKLLVNLQKEQMILDLPNEHPEKEVTPPAKMVVTNATSSTRLFSNDIMRMYR